MVWSTAAKNSKRYRPRSPAANQQVKFPKNKGFDVSSIKLFVFIFKAYAVDSFMKK